jgi:uncharacterized membrane protein YsdA (DUF1294 family)
MKQVGVSLLTLALLGGGFGLAAGAQSQAATAKSKGVTTATHVRVFEGAG